MPSRARRSFARLVAAIAVAVASLLPAAAPVRAAGPAILKVGTIESLRSLNPYQAAYFPDYETFQLNYSLLVDIGPNLEPFEGFADKWNRSADGKSWTFHIRTGMKWSDGQPADSADACFSYGLVIDALKNDTNVGNGYIDPALKDARVTKAECPDAETMLLFTDDGTTKVLKTSIPILPKHIFSKETYKTIGDSKLFKPPLVGTGQYTVADYTPDEHVHLVRNPNYWGKKGFADEVYIQIFKNADTMVQALKTGDIDYARAVPVEQFNQLKGQPSIQTVNGKLAGWVELGFNNYGTGTGKTIKGGGPSTKALLDPAFRDAVGYAIDKPALVEKVRGGFGVVGSTQVPPVMMSYEASPPFPWHTEPANLRTFNIETAKQKLVTAGYVTDASGNRLDKEGKPISLHLVMPDSDPSYPQVAQFIQDWFGQLGIKVKSDVIEENALYDIMLPPEAGDYKAKYDMFIWSWYETVEPNVLLQIFLCNQIGTSSDSLWCNHDYDKLYDEQNLAPTDAQRKVLIDQMQQLFYDQAPYHILYYDEELDAYRTDHFGGWQNQPIDGGYPLFSYSSIDYQFLTDPNAVPSPSPSQAAPSTSPGSSQVAVVSASPAATPAPSPAPASSEGPPILPIIVVVLVVVVVAAFMFTRRRGAAEEEE
jgi:peptide/nickel transport system substrate-binding protein